MKTIPFTRFHLPNGRQSQTSIEVDDEMFKQWELVRANGFRMTVEILGTGAVSQCIEDPELGDFDIELCRNEPGAPWIALKKLLLRFDPKDAAEWKESVS